jgi:hypothetical protein
MPAPRAASARQVAEHPDRAAVGLENIHNSADGRRFASSVRAEQAEQFARLNRKREVIDRTNGIAVAPTFLSTWCAA